MRRLLALLVLAAIFSLLWWALTEGEPAWGVGAPVILLATVAAWRLRLPGRVRLSLAGTLRFLPYFVWQSLRGGVDVARRALDPRLPLDPALLVYRLRLPPGPARVFLADVVSLLPGTLSAELAGDRLRLHVLDRASAPAAVRELEGRVGALFGARPGRR